MSLKHGLLGLLNYGSMTGYELDKTFRDSLWFFWQAKTSQIYRELDTMEHRGWLTSKRIIQNERPNKRVYAITDSGKEELRHWLSMPESDIADAMRVKSAFLMRVFFAGETSVGQSLEMLRAYREKCMKASKKMIAAYESISKYETAVGNDERSKYWKIAAIYGDEFIHACLTWSDKAIAILEKR